MANEKIKLDGIGQPPHMNACNSEATSALPTFEELVWSCLEDLKDISAQNRPQTITYYYTENLRKAKIISKCSMTPTIENGNE